MTNKFNNLILVTNATVYFIAKLTIFLTLVHFFFTISTIHAIIVTVSYLSMILLDFQLKYMIKRVIKAPELKVVELNPRERN